MIVMAIEAGRVRRPGVFAAQHKLTLNKYKDTIAHLDAQSDRSIPLLTYNIYQNHTTRIIPKIN